MLGVFHQRAILPSMTPVERDAEIKLTLHLLFSIDFGTKRA